MDNKKQCPCAAVVELKVRVKAIEREVEKNEKRIKTNEGKLSSDFASIKIMTTQLSQIIEDINQTKAELKKTMEFAREEDNDFRTRVKRIIDDILKWAILLLLSFVAASIGLQ